MSDSRKNLILKNFDASAEALTYLVSSLEQIAGFDKTIKEIKETIGDLVCAKELVKIELDI